MKITVSSTALNEQLQIAGKVLQKKNPMPILECFLIEAKDNVMKITASNSEICLITHVPLIEQESEGCMCLHAEKLLSTIKEIPEQPLSMEYNENTFELKCKHSCGEFKIVGNDANLYPRPLPVSEGMKVEMSSRELVAAVSTCSVATIDDDIQHFKKGVYFDIQQDKPLIIVATDGRKLVRKISAGTKPEITGHVLLPKSIVGILKSVVKKDCTAEIAFDEHRATITIGDSIIYFRQIDGKYPNYNAVIPAQNSITVVAERLALIGALKRVGVFCNQSSNLVKLELSQNQVTLTGSDSGNSTSAEEYVQCEYDGAYFSIGFGYTFLVEILNTIETENVSLEFADPGRPCIVKPVGDDNSLLMLLMPMRIES
ncbi:MAG: DNA polymerase III subunit beta [Prevotella sp.]|nr:DNA polymerase III subunit beta [Prevotella sp.]MBR1880488.1 DNA polymerase III subunit beta [Prevotella sp.]